eukprot:gene6384-4515_t
MGKSANEKINEKRREKLKRADAAEARGDYKVAEELRQRAAAMRSLDPKQ